MNVPLILPRAVAPAPVESCGNCRFAHVDQTKDRVCRKLPPQVSILLVPQRVAVAHPTSIGVSPQPFATFPPVNPEMWCGAWEGR